MAAALLGAAAAEVAGAVVPPPLTLPIGSAAPSEGVVSRYHGFLLTTSANFHSAVPTFFLIFSSRARRSSSRSGWGSTAPAPLKKGAGSFRKLTEFPASRLEEMEMPLPSFDEAAPPRLSTPREDDDDEEEEEDDEDDDVAAASE